MSVFWGCDPGLGGALAQIQDGRLTGLWDMPRLAEVDWIDVQGLHRILTGSSTGRICLEQVQAMGTDGRGSLGRFMAAYGAIRAVCALSPHEVTLVRPQTWKGSLGLIEPREKGSGVMTSSERTARKKASKERSVALALELYPEAAPYLKRKKDHDRAEAILLAHYIRNQ